VAHSPSRTVPLLCSGREILKAKVIRTIFSTDALVFEVLQRQVFAMVAVKTVR
jgi:hypothetical protein